MTRVSEGSLMIFESMYKSFGNVKKEILQIGFWVDLTPFVLEMMYSINVRKKCPRCIRWRSGTLVDIMEKLDSMTPTCRYRCAI